MRATESNFRGERSESGIFSENSSSSAETRSASVKESSTPDSKSDSSGVGSIGFPATCLTISTIFVRVSISGGYSHFGAILLIRLKLVHDIGVHHGGEPMVTGGGEVHEVCLGEAGVDPVAHSALTAHAAASVPESNAVRAAGGLLGIDNLVDTIHYLPSAVQIAPAVARAHHQDGGGRNGAAEAV